MKKVYVFLFIILFACSYLPLASSSSPYIIGSKDLPSRSRIIRKNDSYTISLKDLIDIFTKNKKNWADSTEIIVVTRRKDSIPNKEFLIKVLGLTPYQYKSRLYNNIYQGKGSGPVEVNSELELLEFVAKNERSIGYVYDYMVINNEDRVIIIQIID